MRQPEWSLRRACYANVRHHKGESYGGIAVYWNYYRHTCDRRDRERQQQRISHRRIYGAGDK